MRVQKKCLGIAFSRSLAVKMTMVISQEAAAAGADRLTCKEAFL